MIKKIKKLVSTAKITPAVNQIELHPYVAFLQMNSRHCSLARYLLENDLISFCKKHNIHVTAFSPLGGKPVAAVALNASVPGPLVNEVVCIYFPLQTLQKR